MSYQFARLWKISKPSEKRHIKSKSVNIITIHCLYDSRIDKYHKRWVLWYLCITLRTIWVQENVMRVICGFAVCGFLETQPSEYQFRRLSRFFFVYKNINAISHDGVIRVRKKGRTYHHEYFRSTDKIMVNVCIEFQRTDKWLI